MGNIVLCIAEIGLGVCTAYAFVRLIVEIFEAARDK